MSYKSLTEMLNESVPNLLFEAKAIPFVDTPEAEEELKKVGNFNIYTEANHVEPGKVMLGYTNEGKHFMVKPRSSKMLDKATLYWNISQYEIGKIFTDNMKDLWVIYTIFAKEGRSMVRGVKTSYLTFYFGVYGEIFNSKKEAQIYAKSHFFGGAKPKVCQIKDIESIIKENKKNYDWICNGIRYATR